MTHSSLLHCCFNALLLTALLFQRIDRARRCVRKKISKLMEPMHFLLTHCAFCGSVFARCDLSNCVTRGPKQAAGNDAQNRSLCGGARYHFLTALRADTRGAFRHINVWFKRSVRPLDRGLREQKQDSKRCAKIAT